MRYYSPVPLGEETIQAAGPRVSVADVLKSVFAAAKQEALRRAGVAIANTPEGQAAIKQELAQRAGQAVAQAAPIGVPLLLAGGVVLYLLLRGRR